MAHARAHVPREIGAVRGRRGHPRLAAAIAAGLTLALAGCGGNHRGSAAGSSASNPSAGLPPADRPIPAGRGPAYALKPLSPAVRQGRPVRGLRCQATAASRYAIHLELYADRLVVPIPAGIGIAPPQRRHGVYVLGGRCLYPLRTYEPTGVVVVGGVSVPTLGTFFAIWGQPLSSRRLGGFRGQVVGFVGGRRWRGRLAEIPLRRHAEIVLEVGGLVPPHPAYEFPPGP